MDDSERPESWRYFAKGVETGIRCERVVIGIHASIESVAFLPKAKQWRDVVRACEYAEAELQTLRAEMQRWPGMRHTANGLWQQWHTPRKQSTTPGRCTGPPANSAQAAHRSGGRMIVGVDELRRHAAAFFLCGSVTDKIADIFEAAAAAEDVPSRLLRLASLTETFLASVEVTIEKAKGWPSGDGRRLVIEYIGELATQVTAGRAILIETMGEVRTQRAEAEGDDL